LVCSFLISACADNHAYVSFEASLAKISSNSYVSPHRSGDADLRVSYNIDLNALAFEEPKYDNEKVCDLTPLQHLGTAITATSFALANRYLRGDDNEISSSLGGTSLAGIAIPNAFAFMAHGGSFRDYLSYTIPSVMMERFPWASALDMGDASRNNKNHPYYNRGNRKEDTLQMALHLQRWHSLSMKSLEVSGYGLSTSYQLAPWIGAMGYNLGDRMRKSDRFDNIFPDRNTPLHMGELVFGASYGYGLAKTLECGK
jgi:hypothetical protein